MAINIDTQDLVNYPGNIKRVTVDQSSVITQANEGDEQYMTYISTTAYSDNVDRTAIQNMYITDFKAGWCKSSGFAGASNKFDVTSDAYKLKVKLDTTVSGIDGSGFYTIELDYDTTSIDGELVAADMEDKIRALADNLESADLGFKMAYMNANVVFKNGKFWIISGSLSKTYSGADRSAVKVMPADDKDVSKVLGFDLYTSSEDMDTVTAKEALVTSGYTTGGDTITLSSSIGAVVGDCMAITDRTNTDYFKVSTVSGTTIGMDSSVIANDYAANETKVQILREQDTEGKPVLYLDNIDKIIRHGIKSIINQIDFSS